MNRKRIEEGKAEIISVGKLLWDKGLATGLNGNISLRIEKDIILLTRNKACLGLLKKEDLVVLNLGGEILEGGQVSTEKFMHVEIYKNFPDAQAIIHTHTTYTNGYFAANTTFTSPIFETRLYLGEIVAIEQSTPTVTNINPVVDALKANNAIVLRYHGTVAMGQNLFDCFLYIQSLEEAIKADVIRRLYQSGSANIEKNQKTVKEDQGPKKYKMFSQEQIDKIVELVNGDSKLKELGEQTQMTMVLAVKVSETGQIHSFHFENGQIKTVGKDEDAEFLITAPQTIWRAVFNREIDPFVATTQKKMDLRGDFARISKWYAPCSRIFELWQQVPVE